jgi:hypothetical protein
LIVRRAILVASCLALGCAASPGRPTPAPTAPLASPASAPLGPSATIESVLSHRPDVVLTLHPRALARDPVYGPLLRRAGELASAYAGPDNLGTTALAVLEQTEEVVVAENDHGREAVIVLRGVPASVDPHDLVDTQGKPLWRPAVGDVRTTQMELAPAAPADAALFVSSGVLWIIASGAAIGRVRGALVSGIGKTPFPGDDTPLVSLMLPGDALPQLRQGALAKVGAGLVGIRVELTPGSEGVIVGNLAYADTAAAAAAETTLLDVTLAFRHRLEESIKASDEQAAPAKGKPARAASNLDILAAAKVERTGTNLAVRAPIPRPWLEALKQADVKPPP